MVRTSLLKRLMDEMQDQINDTKVRVFIIKEKGVGTLAFLEEQNKLLREHQLPSFFCLVVQLKA